MSWHRALPMLALASAALLGAAAIADDPAPQPTRPSWREPAGDAGHGEELAQVCLTCHVANSPQTNPPAPKLRRQRESYIVFALLEYRDGVRKSDIMAPFASELHDQDARDLAAYLAGEMLKRPPRARTDMAAYAITSGECAWCHGETGIGEFEGMPVLAGQNPGYIELALKEYRAGLRQDATMRAVAADLTDEQISQLSQYYAAHEWLEHQP